MSEVKPRKRRSPEETAKDKAEKEARLAAREADRLRKEEAAAAIRAEMAKRDHDTRLEHERRRVQQRMFQEAGIEFIMGYDTPAARLFARYVKDRSSAVTDARRRAQIAGDPLNLTNHTKKPSEKQEQKQAEKDRLARGERKIIIPDPDSPRQNVMVSALPHSFIPPREVADPPRAGSRALRR
jgi:hypothetical protein